MRICQAPDVVAVTWERRAEADEIASTEFLGQGQELGLCLNPFPVLADNVRARSVLANNEGVSEG